MRQYREYAEWQRASAGIRADDEALRYWAEQCQVSEEVIAKALARATIEDDMYAPVAQELGVDRSTAKVAVLGAMYGQTTGHGARALRRLESAYPVAMAYLQEADRAGQLGRALRTYGGRLIPWDRRTPTAR